MATNYPSALDTTLTTLPDNKLDSTLTGSNDHAGHHNNLADAIIAVETALGINPQGSYATVAAALLDKVILAPTANQTIQGTGDIVGLAVKATAAQNTANVFEMRLSNNAIGAYIDKVGNLSAQALKIAGTALAASHLSNGTTGTGAIALAAGPTFTGTPAAPTAAVDTNTTQLATTAFVLAQAASASPLMDGTVAVGTSTRFARADHVHPSDTSRLALGGGTMTGQLVLATTGVKFNDGTTMTTAATGPVTYRKNTPKAVNTTSAATDLLNGEITIAANKMGATGMLRFKAWGDWLNNTGGNTNGPRWQLVFGGQTFFDTNTRATMPTSGTRWMWSIEAIIKNAGATNSQDAELTVKWTSADNSVQNVTLFTTGNGKLFPALVNTGGFFDGAYGWAVNNGLTVDTTSAQALILNTINGSASASFETKLFGAIIEIL